MSSVSLFPVDVLGQVVEDSYSSGLLMLLQGVIVL